MASFRRVHIEMQRREVCVGDCMTRKRTPAHCGGVVPAASRSSEFVLSAWFSHAASSRRAPVRRRRGLSDDRAADVGHADPRAPCAGPPGLSPGQAHHLSRSAAHLLD